MRAAWLLFGYAAAVFALGAVLAYPVYALFAFCCSDAASFHEIVQRLLKLCALVMLWPLMHYLGLRSRSQWGYGVSTAAFAKHLGIGLVYGLGSLGLVVAILVLLEVRLITLLPALTPSAFVALLGEALLAGLLVSLIEETWFRGALFSVIDKVLDGGRAIWVTAVLFGAVHFIRTDPAISPLDPGWSDGFAVLGSSFYLFADAGFADSFLALVAAGFLLGLMRQRAGHIAVCIGVHAGWVVVIKITKKSTEINGDSALAFLVGSYDGVIGYLACLVLGLVSLGYYRLTRHGAPAQHEGDRAC